ncbi:hypothetical protein OG394_04065 [Kribbella sp. NBC_01245]|nr:hypothetical protein [Kribbella sp. NBC_01245]
MDVLKLGTRVGAELIGKVSAQRIVPTKSLGGPAHLVEGQEQPGQQRFSHRILGGELGEPR